MIRIVIFALIFVIFTGFIVLNLQNHCDISFGFITLKDIPIFLSVLCSFTIGMLVTLPMLLLRKKVPNKPVLPKETKNAKKAVLTNVPDEIAKEKSPYGID